MTLLSIVIFTICLAIQCTSMETDIDTKTTQHGGGMHTYIMCYLYHSMCITLVLTFKENDICIIRAFLFFFTRCFVVWMFA